MRLVTRSDFDGLACATLLKQLNLIDDYLFAHPKDLQDGKVEVTEKDILANVPYVEGCGLWFDHHTSETDRLGDIEFEGASKPLPSCARVIYEYYGASKFPASYASFVDAVDKVDSANLTADEIANPTGWILLGYIMDPRTGLGRYRDFRISNYQLMLDMIEYCRSKTAEEIMEIPDVKERIEKYQEDQTNFIQMLNDNATVEGNVIILDLRDQDPIYCGNRFMIYTLFSQCNVSIRVIWGFKKQNVVFTVGHSILNRTSKVDIGALMLSFGGGGHKAVGTCQVADSEASATLKKMIDHINTNA
ncbi:MULTISPECIES: exopolyphosphatase [unclassified Pseudodesulfovibrio]|uniref:exopolyphosphatase n=1 Tax=unclassified Pseudodesulfovibrio TaxID=2661612 RepID=UPI000FEB5FC3|nr:MULTISPECIES: exopolyphosphatase [unclassified Pseudodesulfovibrio]MCJ2163805.1 exopolyphosphatase [Pseudodesulfovibrio sp. S3-i]RWU05947.1 exopolyphosphatase [Pseudodesulfovibrio sp. S3]